MKLQQVAPKNEKVSFERWKKGSALREGLYGLDTPSPDNQTKSCQTEPDEKVAGSVWLPGPKIGRKIEGSWPD